MSQLKLSFSRTPEMLRELLQSFTGSTLSLKITDNSTSLISTRRMRDTLSARMHRMFLHAGEDVLGEIAAFILNRKTRTPLIRQFIRDNQSFIKKRRMPFRQDDLHTNGKYFDLKRILDKLNGEYFQGRINVTIGWGRESYRRVARKRILGTYCRDTRRIRINPMLDRRTVPEFFIRFVVYHEMLHSVIEAEMKHGRRYCHTPEFRRRERLFQEYAKAIEWEKRKLQL